jgi:hypothetical protein
MVLGFSRCFGKQAPHPIEPSPKLRPLEFGEIVFVWACVSAQPRLYSNCRFTGKLVPPDKVLAPTKHSQLSKHWIGSDGKARTRGGPELKASQAYPRNFGVALVRLFEHSAAERAQLAEASEIHCIANVNTC